MEPLHERALATMDIKLAFSLIDRMLGGPGKPLDKTRALTTIEQSLLENVIRRFLDQLAAGWKELVTFNPVVDSREMDPQFVQVIPSSEMVLVATFSLTAPGEIEPGELCFCIPFISLEGMMSQLGNQFRFAAMRREQTPSQRKHLDHVVKVSALPVKVTLGTTTLTVGEVMAMQPGDVLVLDQPTDSQMIGSIAGTERLLGHAGVIGRHSAYSIDRVLPVGKGPLDKE
jgi:flagellar motor switch protein FliM